MNKMTTKDLIEKLKAFPPDAQVLVQGYEGGYDSIIMLDERKVVKVDAVQSWDGEYDDAVTNAQDTPKAVVIIGNRRQ